MSSNHKSEIRKLLWFTCFSLSGLLAARTLAAQDPTAQTAVNNIESLGVIPATQPLAGLGFNIDTTSEWEFSLAASAGTTHVRFQCSWSETEKQTAPPMNASGGYALSPNCKKALALSQTYGMHPTVIAAFGSPFHPILTVSLPNGAAAGATTLGVQFAAGIGGDTLECLTAFSDAILSSNGNQLSSRNSYAGDLITSVVQTDSTHATLTLASALTSRLPADDSTYTINEYLFPPAATSSVNEPSVTAYVNYARFLAQSIAAAGLTGEVEIWNEPPWSPDPWDVRQNFYDVFPGPGLPGPIAGNEPNWGFATALSKPTYTVPGVPYVWAGTNKSADNSLLALGMLLNTGSLLVQPVTNVKTESIHPYGNNPEDDIWSEACVKSSILPNPLKPLYFTLCNLDSNSTSNVVELEQLNLIAKVLNPNGGIGHSITETGFSLSGGDLAHEARFVMRQFLAFQAVGVTPVEFYRLYDTSPDDLTFTNLGTNAPLPAFTAISGFMADLATIKGKPVAPATASNLPSIVSYAGFFPLDTVSIVGSRPGDTVNSEVFAVWQRSHVTGSAKWAMSKSPAAVPVTVAIPTGSTAVSVVNLDTRAPIAFTVNSQQITFPVSDDPLEVLVEPSVTSVAPSVVAASIAPATASVFVGSAFNFTCTATFSDGSSSACVAPVYTSSNPSVATVSNGAVQGVAAGSATITASVTGISSSPALLTVIAPAATVVSISITPATASVLVGGVLTFGCTANLSDGTTAACAAPVYSTSNTAVASLSSNAVTGISAGTATITVSVAGVPSSSAVVTVTAAPTTVVSISIAPTTASIAVGGVFNFSCTTLLSDGTAAACASPVYSSSNSSIASAVGNAITGVAVGSATVTVSVAGVTSSSAALTVTAPATTVSFVSISPVTASVAVGSVVSFGCKATLSNGTTAACTAPVYTSSNPGVASGTGDAITGVAAGSANITVAVVGVQPSTAQLTVTAAPPTVTTISIAPGTASILEGAALKFNCTATLSDGTTAACTSPVYNSSDPAVATLLNNAVVGVTPGNATITASIGGTAISASAIVTVTAPAMTSGTLAVSPLTGSTYGAPVVLTETTPVAGGACSSSMLSFTSGGNLLGQAKLVASPPSLPTSCVAAITTTALPVGINALAATASAEGAFGGISSWGTANVAASPGSADTLSVGPTSSTAGSPVTVSFRMPNIPGALTPATGSVVFTSGGITLGFATLTATGSGAGATTAATLITSSLPAGSDAITGKYPGDQNYGPASPSAVETVTAKTGNPTPATIAVSSATRTYDGAAQGVVVTTVPAGIAYDVTYNGSSRTPIDAGLYSVIATITNPSYSAQPATGTLTISKAQSQMSWTPYTTVSSPDVEIGSNVLNAQCSVPGEIGYLAHSGASEAIAVTSTSFLAAGDYTLTGVCSPTDATDYMSSDKAISFSVISDSVFVANGSGDVARFFDNGNPQGPSTSGGGMSIAVDPVGNVWSINSNGESVSKFAKTGTVLLVSAGGGLASAKAMAVDGSGRVWVVNGTGTMSAIKPDGSPVSATAYANPGLSDPVSVSIDFKGSVWVANESSDSITEVIGVAAPTVTPIISSQTQH